MISEIQTVSMYKHTYTPFLWHCFLFGAFSASIADEQRRIAVRLNPQTQTLYSSVLQLPFVAIINVEIDVDFSRSPATPSIFATNDSRETDSPPRGKQQQLSQMNVQVFMLFSKGAEIANHTLLDQPLSSPSHKQRLQLQLRAFNNFSVQVVVTEVVQIFRLFPCSIPQ
jgi:hypothetical protein